MRIEAMETIKSGGWVLSAGDSVEVPDAIGLHWVQMGWARDPSGAVETGERRVIRAVIKPHGARSGQAAQEV
jgi:hypothetical protein